MILYSTGCPRCRVLQRKLDEAGISYEVNSNIERMTALGLRSAPALEVDCGRFFNNEDKEM